MLATCSSFRAMPAFIVNATTAPPRRGIFRHLMAQQETAYDLVLSVAEPSLLALIGQR